MDALGFDVTGVAFWNRLKEHHLTSARDVLGVPRVAALEAERCAMGWAAAARIARSQARQQRPARLNWRGDPG
jgi:hypothetical protein